MLKQKLKDTRRNALDSILASFWMMIWVVMQSV